jgi:antitoxin YefM
MSKYKETSMDAITINQAKQDINRLIEKVISNAEPTIICNDHGQKAVLLSLDEYNSWNETLYLLSNPANAEHLRRSIQEDKAGKIIEQELDEL